MEVSGQLHAPAALPPGKEPPTSICSLQSSQDPATSICPKLDELKTLIMTETNDAVQSPILAFTSFQLLLIYIVALFKFCKNVFIKKLQILRLFTG
jgi:hypothetical protein